MFLFYFTRTSETRLPLKNSNSNTSNIGSPLPLYKCDILYMVSTKCEMLEQGIPEQKPVINRQTDRNKRLPFTKQKEQNDKYVP